MAGRPVGSQQHDQPWLERDTFIGERRLGPFHILGPDPGVGVALKGEVHHHRIAHEVVERNQGCEGLYLVAIPNGGVPLGRMLAKNLEEVADERVPLGILDTTLYRDDLSVRGERPPLRETEMPSSVDDHVVILVEDVVNTGRTIRAAMDALMDFGRPRAVQVVALIDRGHRELPIRPDFVGKNLPTRRDEVVDVHITGVDLGVIEK